MIIHNINPALFEIFGLQIRYYGLFYALGFVIAYLFLQHLAKKKHLPLSKDDISDYLLYALLGVVIGARLIYALFYNPLFYLQNPLDLIQVWKGGLSFHGGLIGAVLVTSFYAQKKSIHFYDLSDMAALPLAIGLGIGRIANFINAELFGRITDVPWCIDYSQNQYMPSPPDGCRHPSQLYESFYSFLTFFILWIIDKKNVPRGLLTWGFIFLYGIFRSLAEFFRQPDPQLGFLFLNLTMGQLLSLPMILLGGYMVSRIHTTHKKSENKESA